MGLEEPLRRRIRRELRMIWLDPPAFCRPGASPVTDLLHWEVVIDGSDGRRQPIRRRDVPRGRRLRRRLPLQAPKDHLQNQGVPPEHQRGRGDDAGHLPLQEPERGDDVHKLLQSS
ncbi:hypothetical protein PVAP13_7KG344770 [Panicum virgatum]|uniref:Uncharacterized protein n=1 Tax=Panicum virgatum TaxID=38727 RepID=A0A8T0QN43_PANVG|nr:hypothetical protein PVAP13_7KG344770 [Panicum virgatum]